MVLNQGKHHFMCFGRNTEDETFVFKNKIMKNSEEQKILGINIDNKLDFKSYVKNLCKKASQKNLGLSKDYQGTIDAQKSFNIQIGNKISI